MFLSFEICVGLSIYYLGSKAGKCFPAQMSVSPKRTVHSDGAGGIEGETVNGGW